jgi:hypothetical protein
MHRWSPVFFALYVCPMLGLAMPENDQVSPKAVVQPPPELVQNRVVPGRAPLVV